MQLINAQTTPAPQVITAACQVLTAGGLLIFPTETTYGAGVAATNQAGVDKLLAYKRRRQGKPLSIAVADQLMAEQYVDLNDEAKRLYQTFLPGPLTVVSYGRHQVAQGVESEFGTLGVRIPNYPLILELLRKFGQPITATSANASGKKRPYLIDDLLNHLSTKQQQLIDLVIDAGQLPPNEPSAVIDTTLSTPITLRSGDLSNQVTPASDQTTLVTTNPNQTKQLAGTLLLKHWDQILTQGLVIGLDGPLGAGKTVFAQGVAEFFGIAGPITSPTYTYLNEYDWTRHGEVGRFFHLDLWKIDSPAQFDLLQLPNLVGPSRVVVIEWWSQIALFAPLVPDLVVTIADPGDETRIIEFGEK